MLSADTTKQKLIMSRTLRKAVETAKQKKETEINLQDEGIAHLEEVPELCKSAGQSQRCAH